MIPQTAITHWRHRAPWPQDAQVEQDLILSRALVEIFQDSHLSTSLALRGGTALHKLYAASALRYSEDLDFVQRNAGPVGHILDALRTILDPLLGTPKRERNPHNVTLRYRVDSEIPPVLPLKFKIEINTREHFDVFGVVQQPFTIHSPWYEGTALITTYSTEELLATKLRALYQRRKGRDLFDLWTGLKFKAVKPIRIIDAFRQYMKVGRTPITHEGFQRNLDEKLASPAFLNDVPPLLNPTVVYNPREAARVITAELLRLL